jgi:hypothetical protein
MNRVSWLWIAAIVALFGATGEPQYQEDLLSVCRDPALECGGGRTFTSVLSSDEPCDLLDALVAFHETGEGSRLRTILRSRLVLSDSDAIRTWTLGELHPLAWIENLTDFEGVFRECDAVSDFSCSRTYVENALVFGKRKWKVDLLARVMDLRIDGGVRTSDLVEFDGFRFEMGSLEAARLSADLGLRELYPLALKVAGLPQADGHVEDIAEWEDGLRIRWELVGTDAGDDHPASVLVERLREVGSCDIVARLTDASSAFASTILPVPSRLRHTVRWCSSSSGPGGRTLTSREFDALMGVLGDAYSYFLSAPSVTGECEFIALDQRLRFFLGGGCSGEEVDRYAFQKPQAAAAARERARAIARRSAR